MNNNNNNPTGMKVSGTQFPQTLVSQQPVYDRKLKILRPRKKKGGGPKFL